MRWILFLLLLISLDGYSQLKDYIIGQKGDTLNATNLKGEKVGKWVIRLDEVRGEPGYEEEGEYKNGRREGIWRRYSLMGDLIAVENYKWGYKDGVSQYFNGLGELMREESWKALNPDKVYDTLVVEEIDRPEHYKTVIVKNEGAGIRHGYWKYYDPTTGFVSKTENYVLGSLQGKKASESVATKGKETKTSSKPKEVLDFEKKNAGKKKVRVQDGSTGM